LAVAIACRMRPALGRGRIGTQGRRHLGAVLGAIGQGQEKATRQDGSAGQARRPGIGEGGGHRQETHDGRKEEQASGDHGFGDGA
jgi:hypothetical protein